MKFTLIVTVGPGLLSKIDKILEINSAGNCIFRLNGAHCNGDQVRAYAKVIRSLVPDAAIMIDLPGNKIRTSDLSEPIVFSKGDEFTLSGDQLNYDKFFLHLKKDDVVLANDSTYKFTVLETHSDHALLRSHSDGELTSNKGLHVTGITQNLPFLFDKDASLVKVAAEERLSFLSISFTRTAADVVEVKSLMKKFHCKSRLIAKIETLSAVNNLDEILDEVDSINVDRGDLSTETGLLGLYRHQKRIIERALAREKNVFLATQFLKNMERNPIPSISEIIDMSNTVESGVTGIQLSEETAVGKYPVECAKLVFDVFETSGRR